MSRLAAKACVLAAATVSTCIAVGCGAPPPSAELERVALGAASQPLYGNNIWSAVGQGYPHGAVGVVIGPVGWCTGTLVTRDVVLTAAHCMCQPGVPGPSASPNGVGFYMPGDGAQPGWGTKSVPIPATSVAYYGVNLHCTEAELPEGASIADLACIHLEEMVPLDVLPDVAYVFTGSPFSAKVGLAVGYGGHSWTQKAPAPEHAGRYAGPVPHLELDSSAGAYWIRDKYADQADETATTGYGDSGGPLFDSNVLLELGVCSLGVEYFDYKAQTWSPTWENGGGNGKWVREHCLDDDDDDQVSDGLDNCTPGKNPQCDSDPSACANFDQADGDDDGVGDVCDNCTVGRHGYCVAATGCVNANQADLDQDGIGDLCDNCFNQGNPAQTDSDGAGIGLAHPGRDGVPGAAPRRPDPRRDPARAVGAGREHRAARGERGRPGATRRVGGSGRPAASAERSPGGELDPGSGRSCGRARAAHAQRASRLPRRRTHGERRGARPDLALSARPRHLEAAVCGRVAQAGRCAGPRSVSEKACSKWSKLSKSLTLL
ncbi:MAG: trypsin-like serine protease [Deltaproteobacteria bacterium]|nr:trypsin-like serine protease [Deltaproteobacteria bacterium]